ncbi:glycosyltransferase family 2 protein [Actinoplanes sp. KI2]|uniref:glycosyltransferase family 2 protein n=1 Tax=Actinoplanes sp. KI2 TaxID=2983315 RepID=UPI0021D56AAF|nr:glycosyltransferase family 2 protein [Actinoplanes sp. KI2]MCU7730057.1 glycosyltransferase family 2 protein [Actinoplanes sp. KI2]
MRNALSETVVLLPVYRPGPQLPALVGDLLSDGWAGIVVVDDGGGAEAAAHLARVRAAGCTVLHHRRNLGKGSALKTGLRHAASAYPGRAVVCADADGQHRAEDIRRVVTRGAPGQMVLGVRRVDRMPLRSRVGNTVTRVLFRAVTGRRVADTQTGLRVFPGPLLGRLGAVPGAHFDYEMNVLLEAARTGLRIDQVEIPTRYLDGNAASNFSGITDSVRVYRALLRHALTTPWSSFRLRGRPDC